MLHDVTSALRYVHECAVLFRIDLTLSKRTFVRGPSITIGHLSADRVSVQKDIEPY